MQSDMLLELKRVCLKDNLFSGVEETFTDSNLFVIVAVLSSAASIPLPSDKIFRAIEFNSDILFYFRALIPGSSFPSRYSKNAPPAVETKLNFSTAFKELINETVSPPPTTE